MNKRPKSIKTSTSELLHNMILGINDADDRETSMGIHLIIAALKVGPNVDRLCEEGGWEADQIRPMAQRLREAKLWSDDFVDDREWAVDDERQMMWVLFLQAHVARGILRRTLDADYACYVDKEGEVVDRIPLPR